MAIHYKELFDLKLWQDTFCKFSLKRTEKIQKGTDDGTIRVHGKDASLKKPLEKNLETLSF